ncbi:probable histone-lysine N-methyltransferase set-23 [Sergentomyia squamirostris]
MSGTEKQSFLFRENYDHLDSGIDYLIENEIFSTTETTKSYEDLREAFNSYLSLSCTCENRVCSTKACLHGGNYTKSSTSPAELVLNQSRKNQEIIYECSQFCKCLENCENRLVQFGPRDHLEIRDFASQKGHGLFTKFPIPAGAFICEYAGELLTKSEAIRRDSQQNPMKYLICLNEISSDGGKHQTFVDPIRRGNIGRYLNHSCNPNCEILSVRIDNIIPKLGIFAKKDIFPDEELTFDYGANTSESTFGEKICLCGSENCRKFLPNTCF